MARFIRRLRGGPSGLENLSGTADGSNLQVHVNSPPSLIRAVAFPGLFGPTISSADVALLVCPGLTLEIPKVAFRCGRLSLYRDIR